MQTLRNALFAVLYLFGVVVIGVITTLFLQWFAYRRINNVLIQWNRWTLWSARHIAGVRWHIEGLENIPAEPTVFVANHESQGETYFLQLLLHPVATVLKRELLKVPFFGIGLRLLEPIAIDRGSPKASMKQMLNTGVQRLAQGRNVLVYPQGTRQPYKPPLKYARGAAGIAVQAGCKLVPIAHNTASFWPAKGYNITAGTIRVVIGDPIDTAGKSPRELTETVRHWTEQQLQNWH